MLASVFIEQGATTIPLALKEPLAIVAPMSFTLWTTSASASMSVRPMSSSCCAVMRPDEDITRWVSAAPEARSSSSRRTP